MNYKHACRLLQKEKDRLLKRLAKKNAENEEIKNAPAESLRIIREVEALDTSKNTYAQDSLKLSEQILSQRKIMQKDYSQALDQYFDLKRAVDEINDELLHLQ